jgi:hypothetical protein
MKEETKSKLIEVAEQLIQLLKEDSQPVESESVESKPLTDIDWKIFPAGSKFTATIDGYTVSGRIQKENEYIYLCQDRKEGAYCIDKLGYRYSWYIGGGGDNGIECDRVQILSLEVDPEFEAYEPKLININDEYEATIYPGFIKVGCQKISNEIVREIASNLVEENNK